MADTRYKERKLLDLLAHAYPNGMSSSELADELGVTAETIRQMLARVGDEAGVYQNDEKGRAIRYFLDPKMYQRPLNLTLAQSWMLYLSVRRIVRAQQHRFPIVNTLIGRLTESLHPRLSAQVETVSVDKQVDDVFGVLVDAWQTHRWLTIDYRPLNQTQPNRWVIAPLWLEPAIWSDSNYVVCWVQMGNKMVDRTLKLDRITFAELSTQTFQPPDIDTILTQIQDAWGIWLGEDEAHQQVVLRFDNRVLDRLRETRWHPTQQIDTTIGDGKVEWRANISEPREMLPWIRGWGADVEVIEPQWLRDEIGAEAERMAKMYGRMIDNDERGFF